MMHRPAPVRNIQGSALGNNAGSPLGDNARSPRRRNRPASKQFRTQQANTFCRAGSVGEEEPALVMARGGSETALTGLLLADSAVMEATQTPRLPPTHVDRSTRDPVGPSDPLAGPNGPFLIILLPNQPHCERNGPPILPQY